MYVQGACGYKGSVPVAVKTLSHEKMKDIDKFMQEVDLMKKFSHPSIVSLIGELACSPSFLHVWCACIPEWCSCTKMIPFTANAILVFFSWEGTPPPPPPCIHGMCM